MIGRILLVAVLAALLLPGEAPAAPSSSGVTLKVWPHFRLVDGGESIVGRARVSCPVGYTPLEGLAFGFQGTDPGAVYAEGFIAVGPCDGRERWSVVRVWTFDTPLRPGFARISAYVLVDDGEGNTLEANAGRRIRITR